MQGTVTSVKRQNTATVEVVRKWPHPLYKKLVKKSKKYSCHVEDGMDINLGDIVMIEETRPMSKTKYFKVVSKVEN